jgi:hypothetical protein
VKWVSQGKKKYLLLGNVMQTMVANPTFNPITKPGIMHQLGVYRGATAYSRRREPGCVVVELVPGRGDVVSVGAARRRSVGDRPARLTRHRRCAR